MNTKNTKNTLVCDHDSRSHLTQTEELLLSSVLEWYNQGDNNNKVTELLKLIERGKRNKCLSLRVIDWLVTNYSRKTPIVIDKGGAPKDMYKDYYVYLSSYNKKYMDPFARRKRVVVGFVLAPGNIRRNISTTIGQLIFFRWFIENDIRVYLEQNRKKIEQDMKQCTTSRKEKTGKKKTHHRTCSFAGRFKVSFS